jgi:2-polyprenyl-6-methoxyphenol hydroxylase-like FAD-dependent oxidoreductase
MSRPGHKATAVRRTRTALVIGGGIAGPAAAIAFHKAGIDSVVFEAHATAADGIGAFLTLASNGVDALRILGADTAAVAAGFPTPSITLRSATGKRLGHTSTGGSLPDGTTSQTIKRADLYRALHQEARNRGLRTEHGKRLVDAHDAGDGIRAVFADGSEAVADVLIGCDGVNSVVRTMIDPAAPAPTYSGLLTTGGYVRGVHVNSEPGSYEMIFGHQAFFGYTMAPDREVWWFANVPRRDEPARGEVEGIRGEDLRDQLLDLYAMDAGPAVALIQGTSQIMPMSPIHTVRRLPAWHNERMIVIGDAAHAPSPTSGQGASLSIEDAVVLAKCLRDLPSSDLAFASFDSTRRARVERIVKWSARINNNKAAGPVARAFRDAMLPTILKLTTNSKALKQTYDHHIPWESEAPTNKGDAS